MHLFDRRYRDDGLCMALPVSLSPVCDDVHFRLLARFLFRRVVEAEAADPSMSTAIKDEVSILAVFSPPAVYDGRVTLGRPYTNGEVVTVRATSKVPHDAQWFDEVRPWHLGATADNKVLLYGSQRDSRTTRVAQWADITFTLTRSAFVKPFSVLSSRRLSWQSAPRQ